MNATIQEIEGIDDYWGPAFRSVYEGEGHEAFVQQLDERIVQHDKEIEKLCNFHYQKKRTRKRGRRSKKLRGAHEGQEEALQNSICEYEDNENHIPKRHCIDPKRLGGYINTFPGPGTHCKPSEAHNSTKVSDNNLSDENLEETLDMGLSSDEYEKITEYHTLQQLKQEKLMSKEPDTSADDLRSYLRNRQRVLPSVKPQNLVITVEEADKPLFQTDYSSKDSVDHEISLRNQQPLHKKKEVDVNSPNDLRFYLRSKLSNVLLDQDKPSYAEHYQRQSQPEAFQNGKRSNHQQKHDREQRLSLSSKNNKGTSQYDDNRYEKGQYRCTSVECSTDQIQSLASECLRTQHLQEPIEYERDQSRKLSSKRRIKTRPENFEYDRGQGQGNENRKDKRIENRPMSADNIIKDRGQIRPEFPERPARLSRPLSSDYTKQNSHIKISRTQSHYSLKGHIISKTPHVISVRDQRSDARQFGGQNHYAGNEYDSDDSYTRPMSMEHPKIHSRPSLTEYNIPQSQPLCSENYKQSLQPIIEYHKDQNRDQGIGSRRFSIDYDKKSLSGHDSIDFARAQHCQALAKCHCIGQNKPIPSKQCQRKIQDVTMEYQKRERSDSLSDKKKPSPEEHYIQSGQSTEYTGGRKRCNSVENHGILSPPASADSRQNRLSYSEFEGQIRHKISEAQKTRQSRKINELKYSSMVIISGDRCSDSVLLDHISDAQGDLHIADTTPSLSHDIHRDYSEHCQVKHRDHSEHCHVKHQDYSEHFQVNNQPLMSSIACQDGEKHHPSLSKTHCETYRKSSDCEDSIRSLSTQRQQASVEVCKSMVAGQKNSTSCKIPKPYSEDCPRPSNSNRMTASHFFQNEFLEKRKEVSQIIDCQPKDRQTTDAKHCDAVMNGSKTILISDSDKYITTDFSTHASNSSNDTTHPEKQNDPDDSSNIDFRSNLTQLKASALLSSRCSTEPRDHGCDSFAEMESVQDESTNSNDSVQTVIVELRLKDDLKAFDERQNITSEPEVKSERNNCSYDAISFNTSNKSSKVTEHHLNQKNKAPELERPNIRPKSNAESESKDYHTNREISAAVDNNIAQNRLQQETPDYCHKFPQQSFDIAIASGCITSNIKRESGNGTLNTVESTLEADLGINSSCSANNEDETIAESNPISSNGSWFNVSVRDVNSINLLLNGADINPLNVVSNNIDECQNNHSKKDFSAVNAKSWYTPRKITLENYPNKPKVPCNSALLNSSDPRLRPRINSRNIEILQDQKTEVFYGMNDVAKSERNIKSHNTKDNKSVFQMSINDQNEILNSEKENERIAPKQAIKCGKLSLDTSKSSEDNCCLYNKVQKSPQSPQIQDEQLLTSLKSLFMETQAANAIPIFDGANKNHNINDWIDSVNKVATIRSWSDKQVVEYATPKIMDYTFNSNLSWSEWQEKLKTAFPPKVNYGKMLLNMLNTTAKVGDSLVKYYDEKKALLDKCDITGEKAIECIIFGVEDESVRTILESLDFDNQEELLKFLSNYKDGFIDSIRELLEVRSHAEELHAEISNVDANVKETTEAICTKAEELIRARRVELNIAATIEKMELCLPLLTTYSKLKTQVEAKRYYPALKTLEQLEHVLLPRVGPYKWCATISADIPRLRQAIRDASMADLRDFLENIRKLSPQVGALSLKQSQEMMGRNLATIVKNKKEKALLSSNEIEPAAQCPHELVDFSPLHRCMHIHTVLGAKNDFIQYYRAQRSQQARLVLIPQGNLHDSIRGVKDYLHAVLGFFILEEHLLSAAQGLVSKDWLLDTWSMSVNKVASTLRTNTSLITDPTLMLSIKHQIVLFINTVKCYGLPVEPLPTLLQEMAEHYTEVLMQRWVAVFRDILDKAAFTPIQVNNEDEYDDVANNFPYDASDLEMQPFPKSFPFSSIVPSVYLQVKEFIYAWLKYSSGLGLGGGRRAAAARHAASLLLSRSFTGCLSALFHSPLPLMQLVQIIVDTQYLEDATVCLYEFISNITGSGPVSTQPVAGLFQTARDEAEQQICENLKKKVDEFLDLENYDWLLVEPTGQASSFVTDMISYLKGVMESLHQLPEQARVAAVRAATNRIAVRLRNLLLEPAVKQISSGALYQLDLDVMQCEQFAASEPVTGLREGELLEHFASLRQLLDLITGWDWSSYLHDVGIEGGKYALVTPRDAATLLEKFKEAEQKSSVFSVLKKNERDKRKLLDTVLKQLKQLQNQDGS